MVAAAQALAALDRYVQGQGLAGPDPYDGLSGRLRGRLPHRRARQAVVQLVKRSPVDLRPVLGVRPLRMTKTLGLVADSLFFAPGLPGAEQRRRQLLDEIVARRGPEAWGYEFDVQTRWGFYAAGTPNIIVTSFAVEALRHSPEHLDEVRVPVREWLTTSMLQGEFIRYVPGSDVLVHNASLLGARALHRLESEHPAIPVVVRSTLQRQRPDGSWPYGEQPGLEWVDGFHTAYVLMALRTLADVDPAVPGALERGARAYVDQLFAPDGRPLYYAGSPGPVDLHNIATGVQAVHELADLVPDHLRSDVLRHLLALQGEDGAFRARPGAPAYMRWNQAHAHRALAGVVGRA